MLVGSRQAINLTDAESIQIGGKNILLNPHVKNLGVFLDNTLSMEQHISHLCRSAYLAMRQIASIRRYLTEKNTVQLVCSFVLSRLDYCNAPLAGLPATHIARLQRIQNNAARLVLQKSKRQHVTPLLKQLHWLPIQTRIDYKLATLAFRHFDGSLLQYFSSRLDISAVPIAQIKQWQASQGSTLETEIFRVQVFQLPRTCRLELSSHWSQTLIFPVLL